MALTILMDMDEVLADFVGGARAAWGIDREQLETYWCPGEWSMLSALSKALGRTDANPLTNEQYWELIDRGGEGFWLGLNPLPWVKNLIGLAQLVSGSSWHVVSSPSRNPHCWSGKIKWLRQHLGDPYFQRLTLTNHKELLAHPEAVLIDDSDHNVSKFVERGGNGIVFPRRNNALHHLAHNPVSYVHRELFLLASKTL